MNAKKECQPLCSFPSGTTVKLEDLPCGCHAKSKLYAMGLIPGTVLDVVSSGTSGPCRIKVRGSDLVLGHGIAEKILAQKEDLPKQ